MDRRLEAWEAVPEAEKPVSAEWGRIDLNLFIPLNALLIERNVTKAAERIFITQPAMSAALAKLRRVFDDPLLVRDGRELVLTPLAESLRQPVQQLLFAARDLQMSNKWFDPAVHQRTFTVMASDYTTTVLLRGLVRDLMAQAPGVRLMIEPLREDFVEFIRSGRCDLLFWPTHYPVPDLAKFPHADLFSDEFIVATGRENDTLDHPLTTERLAAAPCVRVAAVERADFATNPTVVPEPDSPTIVTVHSSILALEMVSCTNLVTTVQRRLFEHVRVPLALHEVEVDARLPRLTMTMFWHPRSARSPAHQWLRDRVQRAADRLC